MAIKGDDGRMYSYESTDLINELKQDIAEFGNIELYAWYKTVAGVKLYTNYDFADPDAPIDYNREVKSDEDIEVIKGTELLDKLIEQNKTI
ncbi:hypothetical protein GNF18_10110 [Ligilactobacillus pobuzihii]|uniref:hypothetical protein n=1 Tax=Ligilactobacillus pobuzihii TaxID=449659 RepID=UPI0019D12A41|nr:hypothetical protein [Ligilactobacillus pobuzihii]MBN7275493.1 hypothetical protein [Ligilactobacillus pobuzihii]